MRTHFDKQLNKLNDELIEMGSMIEKAIEHTIKALVTQDIDLAKYVIDSDEQINRQERDIESLCLKLLLQQQPVARDLRQISSALKMITDMERIGDHASDISEIIVTLLKREESYIKHLDHIQSMAKETSVMLVGSVDAFVNRNQLQAAAVIEKDDVVDDLFRKVQSELVQLIHEDPNCGEQATDLLMIAKYFERIGDHATNISEWVIFSLTGEHVHGKLIPEEQTQ
ncbi:phosphate signaling complex protein PhoU [Jutongia huaianensis]|uniref:Phosphate-specific transport system accessory protein PhoU n=1 Tax=Jutongia huaianensis TaxID=2763668 RepID=A0ABR7MZ11_9FIRM|nr:phosphate signaling complex protein PhoU [Jutongia huaianensis]MBC8561052.1 phosphate signaling complex protein PhoU [Jutongia huaianensis]